MKKQTFFVSLLAVILVFAGSMVFGPRVLAAVLNFPNGIINSSGNMGVGTTNLIQKLNVAGEVIANEGTWGSGGYSFIQDGSQDTGMFSPSDGVIDFYNNQNHSINISAGGAVKFFQGIIFPDGTTQSTAASGGSSINASNVVAGTFGSAVGSGNFTFPANLTVANKITFGTADPVYSINGTNYATYMSGMTGVKEETMGMVTLACANAGTCSSVIDFNNLVQGSDIWLFSKATNLPKHLSDVVVIISPSFDGRVWYKKDLATGTLTIYGDQAGEVSYRLGAPRFDAAQWPNLAPAGEKPNFTIN